MNAHQKTLLTAIDQKVLAICLASSFLILFVDSLLPLGVAAAVPYVFVVAITVWAPRPRIEFYMAFLTTGFTVLGYYLSPPGGVFWMVIANRFLALLLIWGAAYVIHKRRVALRSINSINDELSALKSNLEVQVAKRTFELSERDALLDEVLDTTDIAYLVVTPLGEIRMANRAAGLVFGCDHAVLKDWNIKTMFKSENTGDIDYLLSVRPQKDTRIVPLIESSDDKGNPIKLRVEARPTKGRVLESILLSVKKLD